MKPRKPQLQLRLEADTPDAAASWHAGAGIAYLGTTLRLTLDTACRAPARMADELHLPLPPAATPRQIRDAAESWLRDEALRTFTAIVEQKSALGRPEPTPAPPWGAASRGCEREGPIKSALAGRLPPAIVLSFGKRSDWVHVEVKALRCHWRLIEQAPAIIEQVLDRALAAWQPTPVCDDLFALV